MLDERIAGEVVAAANASGIEPAALLSVVEIESNGRPFEQADGVTPCLLFERHVFHRELAKRAPDRLSTAVARGMANQGWQPKTQYRDQRTSAQRLELLAKARAIDAECANRSCSWGLGQTMGFQAEGLGFASATAMLDFMTRGGVSAQVDLMVREIKRLKVVDALNRHEWATFARAYNGTGFRQNQYDTKLAAAYARWVRHVPAASHIPPTPQRPKPDTPAPTALAPGTRGDAVVRLQAALKQRGYAVGEIDGDFGPATAAAVKEFQHDAHLPETGIADQATLKALGTERPSIDLRDILRRLVTALVEQQTANGQAGGGKQDSDILRLVLAAFMGKAPVTSSGATMTPDGKPILSFIDKVFGGEALTGKKTALSIIAYAVLAILKAAGAVGAATPTGQILTLAISAFGALGGLSKVDRIIQALGMIVAKR
jgi:hypothetical protein